MQHVAENLSKATGGDKWVLETFRRNCKKKKSRRVEEMTRDFAKVYIFQLFTYIIVFQEDDFFRTIVYLHYFIFLFFV